MARPCSICFHANCGSIEAAVRNGASHRAAAKSFPGATASAIQRHMRDHAKKSLSAPASPPRSGAVPAPSSKPASSLSTGFMFEKERLTQAQADKAEMENARIRGELLEAAAVEKTWDDLASHLRSKCLGLPRKLASLLVGLSSPVQAEAILTTEIHSLLTELSSHDIA